MQKYSAERLAEKLRAQGYDVRAAVSRLPSLGWEVLCKPVDRTGPALWDPDGNFAERFCLDGLVRKLGGRKD